MTFISLPNDVTRGIRRTPDGNLSEFMVGADKTLSLRPLDDGAPWDTHLIIYARPGPELTVYTCSDAIDPSRN